MRRDRRARDAARRPSLPHAGRRRRDARGRRLADPLHGRRPRRLGTRRSGAIRIGSRTDRRVSRARSADEIAEGLAEAAIERHGGEPRDDIAILVLHRSGDGELARRPVHVGCSGWVYPHWRERFYPKGVPQRRWLRLLRGAFRHGRDQQHLLPARLAGGGRELARAEPRGIRLRGEGEPLPDPHQAPHHARAGHQALLRARSRASPAPTSSGPSSGSSRRTSTATTSGSPPPSPALPAGRHAFEFRHESWFTEEVYALLREHGVALVIGDESLAVGADATCPHRRLDLHPLPPRQPRPPRQLLRLRDRQLGAPHRAVAPRDRGLRLLQQRLGGLRDPERQAAQEARSGSERCR